ncbi:hypothetical protein SLH46_07540 [Draconibacterium sp. IB214405]|uniref:hypothetical protein n=1 Tax=Draconibacterium sp. IB214405 TaxID=3097352 RepID=UPI002A0F1520|nr:hypothetical protein [Draconibacterium sp. IB214405]MDX8339031.1 hypothetical protein [Draconibacterium sp. IB214405]
MKHIGFDLPVEYTISIQGLIDSGLKEVIGRANILRVEEDGGNRTELQILVKDQSHLNGILNTFFDARYVILNMKVKQE